MAEVNVSANEDLMQEHGVLNRLLLIYDEIVRRLVNKEPFNPKLIQLNALIIKEFVENHHEKTEETYVFPVLIKTNMSNLLMN